mmetsp:Transcript_3354/g.8675  ORF Transcript_3354/g.8675 Transcript_3354/m.8675 type:complete len:103 (-) Transcript_3354:202-510(-)
MIIRRQGPNSSEEREKRSSDCVPGFRRVGFDATRPLFGDLLAITRRGYQLTSPSVAFLQEGSAMKLFEQFVQVPTWSTSFTKCVGETSFATRPGVGASTCSS